MTAKTYNRFVVSIISTLMTIASCSMTEGVGPDTQEMNLHELYEYVLVSVSDMPLYADLDGSQTKSSGDVQSDMVSLESLIDRTKSVSKTFKQYRLTEIPFINNATPSCAILSENAVVTDESCSEISLFLIETTDTLMNTTDRKVVTMIPDNDYIVRYPDKAYSYINKEAFSGVILYSDIDGRFRDVYVYGGDFNPIINAEIIDSADISSYTDAQYLFVVDIPVTKCINGAEDGGCLYPSICIAYRKNNPVEEDDEVPPYGQTFPGGGGTGGGGGSGSSSGGGSSTGTQQPFPEGSIIPGDQVPEEIQKYNVTLYSAEGGTTNGSGAYLPGMLIFCDAIPDDSYVFDRWTGDFNGKGESVTMMIKNDISSTAYFRLLLESGPARPCYDEERNIYNPLKDMSIAPTDIDNTNYIGSTYGNTRNEGLKEHQGLDLYAPEGTPVYAMYDGVISTSIRFVTCQPNRNSDNWPVGYNGDTDGAGNRFSIECEVDGNVIYFVYWHMMAETPMAINPRTGTTFKPGDEVFAGEIVGYTGRTGNAYDVDFPHLHLGVMNNSYEYLNPEYFINGSVQWSNDSKTNLTETEIDNIRCDEENDDENQFNL